MISRDSRIKDTVSDPTQSSGTPMLGALEKLVSGEKLTNSECNRICLAIFMPVISRKYQWVKKRAGFASASAGRTSGPAEDQTDASRNEKKAAGETDKPVKGEDVEDGNDYPHRLWGEKTVYCPEQPDSGRFPELESDEVTGIIDTEPSEHTRLDITTDEEALPVVRTEYDRDPFSDPVTATAISELWARFSRINKTDNTDNDESDNADATDDRPELSTHADPTLNIWQYALRTALRESEPDVRESTVIRYLRTCARNELTKWLQEGSCWNKINSRLRRGISGGGYTVLRAGTRDKGVSRHDRIVPSGHEDWPPLADISPARLCLGLIFPALRGDSQGMVSLLPTSAQFRDFLESFFRVHRAAATVEQLLKTAQAGWRIKDDQRVSFPDDETSDSKDDNASKPSGEDIKEMSISPNRSPSPIETAAARLIAAIEAADGCRIDPPPDNPKTGKLGRLLLQYAIWAGMPCTDTESGKYGIERYAQLTGYGRGTENDRYNQQLAVIFRKLAKDYAYNLQMIIDLTVWLREKYLHRKPETVIFDSLTHGEQ